MPIDWKEISDDENLNFEGGNTALNARYDRILRHKETLALKQLKESISNAAKLQSRSLWVTLGLTAVIAIATIFYTVSTWQSVQVQREANAIQREVLETQPTETPRSTLDL